MTSDPIELTLPVADSILNSIYTGHLPTSARHGAFAEWVKVGASSARSERYTVLLEFGSARLNIGDVATGRVKSIVDCLYPILGGLEGAPEDWRINRLQVVKGRLAVEENSVRVTVWPS
jgi:hypothetical protein